MHSVIKLAVMVIFYSTLATENDPQRREAFQKHICKPIQTRVLNVFKHWVGLFPLCFVKINCAFSQIDKYFYDFQDDPKLLEKFDQFLKIMVMAKAPEFGKQLKKRLDKAATAPDIVRFFSPPSAFYC